MGGEGSMSHALHTLRQNRALLKKRKVKTKGDVYGNTKKTKITLKKSTPHDMKIIRQKIKGYKREDRAVLLISWAVLLLLFFGAVCLFFPQWVGLE